MNRFRSAAFFLCLLAVVRPANAWAQEAPPRSVATAAVASAPSAHHGAKAPADEYFGRFKMSILGVRNAIADIDARVDTSADDAARNFCHKLVLAEDALRDWQAKYPDDTWIPKFGYAMLKDFEKIDAIVIGEEFHDASVHAIDLGYWLEATYPNSEFAPK